MIKVLVYSFLLILGLIGSQLLPLLDPVVYHRVLMTIKLLSMTCLSFIMIHVGLEFTIRKHDVKSYLWDYFVAATAAGFPWIFCALYFVYFIPHVHAAELGDVWRESLISARFAAPTSAGVLFSMLAAAGLASSWVFRKARVLAVFDDLDTILFMIPLKMMIIGLTWEMPIMLIVVTALLWCAWHFMHQIKWPVTCHYIIGYAAVIALISEAIFLVTSVTRGEKEALHFEVLLPAFVLGVVLAVPKGELFNHEPVPWRTSYEKSVINSISMVFMALVGLSMPPFFTPFHTAEASEAISLSWQMITLHVLAITVLANLGKMFPAFCYRREATLRQRIALAIGMCPRGEVGAGVIMVSLSVGIQGPMLLIASLSLALNLAMTGIYILLIRYLIIGRKDVCRIDQKTGE